MDERYTLSAMAKQVSLACCLYILVFITTPVMEEESLYFPLVLLPYGPCLYLVNRLFLRTERTMRGLAILNGTAFALLLGSVLYARGWRGLLSLFFTGLICMWPTLRSVFNAQKPPTLHDMILSLDASMLLLVVSVAYVTIMEKPLWQMIPAVTGCAAAVLGVISRRISRPMGTREWGVITLSFCGIFGVMWLLVSVAAVPAGQGLVALWNGLMAVLRFLGRQITRLMMALAKLFPESSRGELPPGMEIGDLSAMEEVSFEISPVLVMILAAAAVAVVLGLFLLLLKYLKQFRVGGSMPQKKAAEKRRRISLFRAILLRLKTCLTHIKTSLYLWRKRNTPEGVFYLLVRRCAKGSWRKLPGETPREFLLRLRDAVGEQEGLAAALEELILEVDAALFAPASAGKTIRTARLIRQKLGRRLKREALRETLLKIRRGVRRKAKTAG